MSWLFLLWWPESYKEQVWWDVQGYYKCGQTPQTQIRLLQSSLTKCLHHLPFCHHTLTHYSMIKPCSNEPTHGIMALFILRKLILQTCKRSHSEGLDVWFLVGPSVYFQTSCVRTAKALARLRGCAGSPEPSLVAYVISTIISWAGSNIRISTAIWSFFHIFTFFLKWFFTNLEHIFRNCSQLHNLVIFQRVLCDN